MLGSAPRSLASAAETPKVLSFGSNSYLGNERRKVQRLNTLVQATEIGLFVLRQTTQRCSSIACRDTGKLSTVFDILNVLATLLQQIEQRHHRGHDLVAEHIIFFLYASLVQRNVLGGQEVGGTSDPAIGAPKESVNRLVIRA